MLDADESDATAELKNTCATYGEIMDAMERDSSISDELKSLVIHNVLNGRWFSAELDAHYRTADLWQ